MDAVDAYLRGDSGTTIRLMGPLAETGEAPAQFILGGAYYTLKNYTEAMKWYRRAANQGYADAQSNLGELYFAGRGAPQSYVQAYLWFSLAAANPASEKKTRDDAVHSRDLVAGKMTTVQIAEARRLASEWKPKPERRAALTCCYPSQDGLLLRSCCSQCWPLSRLAAHSAAMNAQWIVPVIRPDTNGPKPKALPMSRNAKKF
jgi:TPR repeat protein